MRHRVAVACVFGVLASLAALPRPAQPPDLASVLAAAGRYLEQYERDVTAVIAQEEYVQRIPSEAKVRRLRSDLLIIAEANVGWSNSATHSRSTSDASAIATTARRSSS